MVNSQGRCAVFWEKAIVQKLPTPGTVSINSVRFHRIVTGNEAFSGGGERQEKTYGNWDCRSGISIICLALQLSQKYE